MSKNGTLKAFEPAGFVARTNLFWVNGALFAFLPQRRIVPFQSNLVLPLRNVVLCHRNFVMRLRNFVLVHRNWACFEKTDDEVGVIWLVVLVFEVKG